jgi:signal transduction histidine kinase
MRDRYRSWSTFLVLGMALASTAVVTVLFARATESRDRLRFQNTVQSVQATIAGRLETYLALLRSASALFAATPVDRARFHAFVTELELRKRYPGVQGIGFAARVPRGDVEELELRMRREGAPGFRVWPDTGAAEATSIVFLEPLDERNRAAIGFDMSTEEARRAAMESARDTGRPAATAPLTLVQEIRDPKQTGFLVYVPLYRAGARLLTEAERREQLVGWVYSPFRGADLLEGIVGPGSAEMSRTGFAVYDGVTPDERALLYRSSAEPPGAGYVRRFATLTAISFGQRRWTLSFFARPSFTAGSAHEAVPLVAAAGVVLSLLFFGVVQSQSRARAEAEGVAAKLAVSEARRTELLRLERDAREGAEAANRLKDEFLATLSHELRTPLNAILGWIYILRSGRLDAAASARAVETIERNARAQAQLVNDLLDVSRIISGKMLLDLRPTEVGPAIESAIQSVRPAAEAKGIALRTELGERARVIGDPQRLQQIVWNLASNAIKFTPKGGRVTVRTANADGRVEITVADTGPGIAPEFLPYIFERFRQADSSTSRSYGGLGLGLAIVRNLTELHGGTVRAASEGEGRGAMFTVALPLLAGDTRDSGERDAEPAARADGTPLMGIKVLIVDDDDDARELLRVMLREAGAELREAASAAEAIGLLDIWIPHVLLSDLAMPGEDGFELIRRVRGRAADRGGAVPAAALTARVRPEDRAKALEAGFQLHIGKPFEPGEVVGAVAVLAGRAHGA